MILDINLFEEMQEVISEITFHNGTITEAAMKKAIKINEFLEQFDNAKKLIKEVCEHNVHEKIPKCKYSEIYINQYADEFIDRINL